jgi:hypothetical protein
MENALAREICRQLIWLSLDGSLRGLWFHVPNESVVRTKTDMIRLKQKKAIGMMAGAPDLVFLKSDGCLQVELKTAKGRLSDNQKAWKDHSVKHEIPYVVARSWHEVKNALLEYGFVEK